MPFVKGQPSANPSGRKLSKWRQACRTWAYKNRKQLFDIALEDSRLAIALITQGYGQAPKAEGDSVGLAVQALTLIVDKLPPDVRSQVLVAAQALRGFDAAQAERVTLLPPSALPHDNSDKG